MTNIHVLPGQLDEIGFDRVSASLLRAIDHGVDLGPRHHHIQAAASDLDAQLANLQGEMNVIFQISDLSPSVKADMQAEVQLFIQLVETTKVLLLKSY